MTQTIEIKLHDGETITAREDPKALAERYATALALGALIEVALSDAETVWINPDAVATIGEPASRGGQFA